MEENEKKDERIELDEDRKKSKFWLFFFLVLLLCICGLVGYKYITFNPLYTLIDAIEYPEVGKNDEPYKITGNLQVESKSKDYSLFNVYSVDFSNTVDRKNNKSLINLNINEGDSSLIDLVAFEDNKDIYFEVSKIYPSKIKISQTFLNNYLKDENVSLDRLSFDINEEDEKYIFNLFKQSLKNSFKDEKYSKSSKTLNINGNDVKSIGYTYTISKDNIQRIYDNFINTFEDDELIKILGKCNIKREDYIELLNEIKDYKIKDYNDSVKITFYIKPFLLNFIGFSISENDKEVINSIFNKNYSNVDVYFLDEDNTTFNAETKNNKTEFELNLGSISVIKGTIDEKDKNEIDLKIDVGNEITIKLSTQYKENAVLEKFDTEDVINLEDLNQEDYASMLYNFSSLASTSPLIQSFAAFFQDDSIETLTQNIYVTAYQTYAYESSVTKKSEYVYGNGKKCTNALPLNLGDNIKYAIKINKAGKVTYFQITDGEKQYSYKGSNLDLEKIKFTDYKGLNVTCK